MDGKYATLKLLMESLYSQNGLFDWNCYPQKNGKIMLKVQFKDGGPSVNKSDLMDFNSDQRSSEFHDMSAKDKHNFLRAKSFRENKKSKKRSRSNISDSPEIARNYEHCFDPRILDSHVCISTESLTREVADSFSTAHTESPLNQNDTATDPTGINIPTVHSDDECMSPDTCDDSPTPFDEESLYDPADNPFHPKNDKGEIDLTPCNDADCFYAQEPYAIWNYDYCRLKRNIFTCSLCGRKVCEDCGYDKRRHFIHVKHLRNYSFDPPCGRPIKVDLILSGNF